ncbi:hypothetical protein BDR26DRAFT_859627 [Obelidium mucronatum]|nr:hypothetical protein BDR26DRAFT_859627 [Obelidium mucronatum]
MLSGTLNCLAAYIDAEGTGLVSRLCDENDAYQKFNLEWQYNGLVRIKSQFKGAKNCLNCNSDSATLIRYECHPASLPENDLFVATLDNAVPLKRSFSTDACIGLKGAEFTATKCVNGGPLLTLVASPPLKKSCPAGSKLIAKATDAGSARKGTFFGTELYDRTIIGAANSYAPKPITVTVQTTSGTAQPLCHVTWTPRPAFNHTNGWIFPDAPYTDSDGAVSAYWVAGSGAQQVMDVSITRNDGTIDKVTIIGKGFDDPGSVTDGGRIYWEMPDPWQRFSVEITPHTWPKKSYYTALSQGRYYAGLLSNRINYSMWIKNGIYPVVVKSHPKTVHMQFDGEGSGTNCMYMLDTDSKVNVTYTFQMTITGPDHALQVTNQETGEVIEVCTMRYAKTIYSPRISAFNENFGARELSCLDNEVRSVSYTNCKYSVDITGDWTDCDPTWAAARNSFNPGGGAICMNYKHTLSKNGYTLSGGGFMTATSRVPGKNPLNRQAN